MLCAIEEYDRLGQEAFLRTYGYGPRTKFSLVHEDREYDPKAILGVAYGYEFPDEGPLTRHDLSGGPETNNRLEKLGFRVIRRGGDEQPSRKNPPWTRDELILALDLYMRHQGHSPDDDHPDVIALSQVLNGLPIHTIRPDVEKFRNPNGVAMKLKNFAALDPAYPGKGLDAGSKLDAEVWDRWHGQPDELHRLAEMLAEGAGDPNAYPAAPEEGEDEVEEGRLAFRLHRHRERNQSIVRRKKDAAMKGLGRLSCEVCGFDFSEQYGALGDGYIECHHAVPLASVGATRTSLKDLVLLCANCHRMAHNARPWVPIEELRALVADRSR